jgi:hypothetical protein
MSPGDLISFTPAPALASRPGGVRGVDPFATPSVGGEQDVDLIAFTPMPGKHAPRLAACHATLHNVAPDPFATPAQVRAAS